MTNDGIRSALLLMDFQVGTLHYARDPDALLDCASGALSAAREAGWPVIHITVAFREGYPEIDRNHRLFGRIPDSGGMLVGSPEAQIVDRLAPVPSDVVVTKHRVGAFHGTPLDTILRAQGVSRLFLGGITTSGVVLSTVRVGSDLGYDFVVLSDCCADGDDEVQRVLLEKVLPMQAAISSFAKSGLSGEPA